MREYRQPAPWASGLNSPPALLYFSLHRAGGQASEANAGVLYLKLKGWGRGQFGIPKINIGPVGQNAQLAFAFKAL